MAFKSLPQELLEMVASHMTDGQQLRWFSSICRETNKAVKDDRSGVWRRLFVQEYDLPPNQTALQLKQMYQTRCRTLSKKISFRDGHSKDEQACLAIVRDLLIESFVDNFRKPSGKRESNNVTSLQYFARRSNLLQNVFSLLADQDSVHPLLQAIQLLFANWSIEFSLDCPTYGFPNSQQAVYSHRDEVPMFTEHMHIVNIALLLHIANFFKYHLTCEGEATLFNPFKGLTGEEKPRALCKPIQHGLSRIGQLWKGSSAYLHDPKEVRDIRSAEPADEIFLDTFEYGEDGFETLKLDFDQVQCSPWPQDFEDHLVALPSADLAARVQNHGPVAPTRGRDYLAFSGTGYDTELFHCSGILHSLPTQQEIPGWQRITFMRYPAPNPTATSSTSSSSASSSTPTPATTNASTPNSTQQDGKAGTSIDLKNSKSWAYEGVVLPGGMMMMGRWWNPMEDRANSFSTGPFIFWKLPKHLL